LAIELLTQAGWMMNADGVMEKDGDIFKIDIVVDQTSSPEAIKVAETIQDQLKKVGIELEIRPLDYTGWVDTYYNNDFDFIMRTTSGAPYDPHTSLYNEFYYGMGEEGFTSVYIDPGLNELIDSVMATTDESERQALYEQIWNYIDSEAVVIPLVFPQRFYVVNSRVEGFRLGGTDHDMAFALQHASITE
jgi:ABC-type transport system substrate-binding protein